MLGVQWRRVVTLLLRSFAAWSCMPARACCCPLNCTHIAPPHTGLPLMNKKVYQREQEVAALRDAKYSDVGEFKDDMRGQRMSIKRGQGLQ